MNDTLLQSVNDRVATLTLNRPDSRNALSPDMRDRLLECLTACAEDPAIGAIVITGSGKAFCTSGGMEKAGRLESLKLAHRIPLLLASMPKVVIAAVNGAATGAGLGLACACDLRIASSAARFGTAFVNIALASEFGVSWNLTRIVGAAKARELLLMGDAVDAAEAKTLGLVSRVFDQQDLAREAQRLAARFANGPGLAHGLLKQNLAAAASMSLPQLLDLEADNQLLAMNTEDHGEALNAFLEKRPPVFSRR